MSETREGGVREVPVAIREAALALFDAVGESEYTGASVTVEFDENCDSVKVDIVVREKPSTESIVVSISKAIS